MNEQVSAFQASSPKLSKGRRKLAFFCASNATHAALPGNQKKA
jgi:hypothetical protein